MQSTVYLIGDDPVLARHGRSVCAELGVLFSEVPVREISGRLKPDHPDVVVCDFKTFDRLRKVTDRLCAIIIIDTADSELAIESIKLGAVDSLLRPINRTAILKSLTNALRISRDMHVPTIYKQPKIDRSADRIIGQSPVMQEVYKFIGQVAPRDINVLITGETGTGKEVVAKAIYHHSARKKKPFLAVNCAAIPETLLESELFGHEKGAFTGADRKRIGKFEQCHGGTLFLDEIGDMALSTQAKLLRILQDGSMQRVGGTEMVQCDVRIIAATNQRLEQLITQQRFREDLYFRLKVASIELPPLRDREVDVVLLAHDLVERFNTQFSTNIRSFAPPVLRALLTYRWPGNVRELENVIKTSLLGARGSVFRLQFLPEHVRGDAGGEIEDVSEQDADSQQTQPRPIATGESQRRDEPVIDSDMLANLARTLAGDSTSFGRVHAQAVAMMEQAVIMAAIDHSNGLVKAAELLGISRTTLRKKMDELRIEIRRSATSAR